MNINATVAIALTLMISGCANIGEPYYGMRFQEPYPASQGGGKHGGLDIHVPIGTPVRSIADGVIIMATVFNVSGVRTNVLDIRHDVDGVHWRSRYIHIDYTGKLQIGDEVKRGEIVAHTSLNGPTGPFSGRSLAEFPHAAHLHLEVYRQGFPHDPEKIGMNCGDQGFMMPVGCKLDK